MPNLYSRLTSIKREYQGGSADTSDDAMLLEVLERVCRGFDSSLEGRHFYTEQVVKIYDCRGGWRLKLPDDYVAIDELALDFAGDGGFETIVDAGDFVLFPYNEPGQRRIDLLPFASLTSFPSARYSARVTGLEGWSHELEASTVLTDAIDNVTTTVPLAAVDKASAGDTLVIGDEQMHLEAIDTLDATVIRGINGTSAVAHLDAAAVSRRRFPRDIELAAVMQTVRFAREIKTGYGGSTANAELAGFAFTSTYPAIRDALAPFHPTGKVRAY